MDGGRVEGAYAAPTESLPIEPVRGDAIGASDGVTIHYQLHGSGSIKVLLIPGLACGHAFWNPYVRALTKPSGSFNEGEAHGGAAKEKFELCTFDNRGVGKSTVPKPKSEYSTSIMAQDALALMDHLGWHEAHICGHSMGGMIALKLGAMAPERVLSLCLVSVSGGGFQCLPKLRWRTLAIMYRFLNAKTLEQRVRVDLDTHYTRDYLDAVVDDVRRRDLLFKEYLKNMESGGPQPRHGLDGHIYACWTHSVRDGEVQRLRGARIPIAVVHGKDDAVAQVTCARQLTKRLRPLARLFELPGGHLVTHQNTDEVLQILLDTISLSSTSKDWIEEISDDLEVRDDRLARRLLNCCFVVLILLWAFLWVI